MSNPELAAKYAAINAKKAAERESNKAFKFALNYVEPEDQSHYRDYTGKPLDHERYSSIRGRDCWYVWDNSKQRWKRYPI